MVRGQNGEFPQPNPLGLTARHSRANIIDMTTPGITQMLLAGYPIYTFSEKTKLKLHET